MLPLKSTGHSGSALEPSSHLEAITSSRTTVKGNEILATIEDLVDKIWRRFISAFIFAEYRSIFKQPQLG